MSNRTLLLLMGFVAFLILIAGVVGVVAIAGGGGDDNTSPASSGTTPGASPKATASGTKSASGGGGQSLGKLCQGKTIFCQARIPEFVCSQVRQKHPIRRIPDAHGGMALVHAIAMAPETGPLTGCSTRSVIERGSS